MTDWKKLKDSELRKNHQKSVSQIRNYDWSISSISGWVKKKYRKKQLKALKMFFLGLGWLPTGQYEAGDSFILNLLVSIFKCISKLCISKLCMSKLYKISITLKKNVIYKRMMQALFEIYQ